MTESDSLRRYLELEVELFRWRVSHSEDTPEEDAILDAMDALWWKLSQAECDWIEARNKPDG